MAKGKKTGGRDFVKGKEGGPGRPPIEGDLKGSSKFWKSEYLRLVQKLDEMSITEIESIARNRETKGLEMRVIAIYAKAISGSLPHAESIFDRTMGPVATKISGDEDAPPVHLHFTKYKP